MRMSYLLAVISLIFVFVVPQWICGSFNYLDLCLFELMELGVLATLHHLVPVPIPFASQVVTPANSEEHILKNIISLCNTLSFWMFVFCNLCTFWREAGRHRRLSRRCW